MKTILLYGELEKRFGKEHKFLVRNAAEAFRAMAANIVGFSEFMSSAHTYGVGFRVFVGGSAIKDYPETHNPSSDKDIIRLVPVIMGSGGGIFKILLGAVLVVAGIVVSAPVLGNNPELGGPMISAGVGLIIGGVAQLLTNLPPTGQTGSGNKSSYLFNGPVNSTAQGGAVPVGYGRLVIGSVIISAGINTDG
jgi:predicted phage tail protein